MQQRVVDAVRAARRDGAPMGGQIVHIAVGQRIRGHGRAERAATGIGALAQGLRQRVQGLGGAIEGAQRLTP